MNKTRASLWMLMAAGIAVTVLLVIPWVKGRTQATEQPVSVKCCYVELGNIEQTIALKGVVRFENEYAALCPQSGYVSAVYVQPGEKVEKGQALFRMEDSLQARNMSSALQRQQHIALHTVPQELAVQSVMSGAAWELEQYVETAVLAMESLTVRAASDGIVQQLNVTNGGALAAGSPGVLLSGEKQEIQAQAVLVDAQKLQPGMQARILYRDEVLCMASVLSVGAAEAVNGQSVCEVRFCPAEKIDLPLGSTVSVEVVLDGAENVPVLPVEALGSKDTVRWVAVDGRCYEATVQVLMADETHCWVDLAEGTRVVLTEQELLQGQRVREAGE